MKTMKVTSKEFIEKVKEVEADLVSKIETEGKREKTIESEKDAARMEAVFIALKNMVEAGENIKTDCGIFYKKDVKGRENKEERTIVMHKGTDKERTIIIPAGKSPDKIVLALKTDVEF